MSYTILSLPALYAEVIQLQNGEEERTKKNQQPHWTTS